MEAFAVTLSIARHHGNRLFYRLPACPEQRYGEAGPQRAGFTLSGIQNTGTAKILTLK
jgi:hypothetical protein